jgi:3-oxoacyl-[acyl-carrier-protein] synthase-3
MTHVGIRAMGIHLPARRLHIDQLVASGQTVSSAAKLAELGYQWVHVAEGESVEDMALAAVRDLEVRSASSVDEIDMIIYGAALPTSGVVHPGDAFPWYTAADPRPLFRYPATWLQAKLGLPRAEVMGVGQMACNSLHGAIRTARAIICSEPDINSVLCVGSDKFPAAGNREVVYNLMSDGACACIVERNCDRNRILGIHQTTRGAFWDSTVSHDRLVSAYFPLVRECIMGALAKAGCGIDDLKLLIPHNINLPSWQLAASILGFPVDRIFTKNISEIGHIVSADNLINHIAAQESGMLQPGDVVAWFVTGFGAHWTCIVLQV